MKLHFESDLDYQLQAIDSVCDLFLGQEIYRTGTHNLDIGNHLSLPDGQLQKNLRDIQLRGGLPISDTLESSDFTIEMETGTGKTYVYLRTIFELNKRYGFSKFVIVVPSLAIKEGVYKTLSITEAHLKGLYAGAPFEYFVYDSAKLEQVRNFCTNPTIQIMVMTVGAINKKEVNNLYKASEKTGGEKPIDLIKAMRPIIIVDEPQSVDGGLQGRGKEALGAMSPLCTLRYSATHTDRHHMVFRLDAVDAYEKKLVKQIEVACATIEDAYNQPFVRLLSVVNKRGRIGARIELNVDTPSGIKRKALEVHDGDDIGPATRHAIYAGFAIGEISTAKNNSFMVLRHPGGEIRLRPGQAYGDIDTMFVRRQMIRRTIREHLDKELKLRPLGIKVLSLFFIDEVAKYRFYNTEGNAVKGDYALIFEDEFVRAAAMPAYRSLFAGVDPKRAVLTAHDGYFSIDKRGKWTDTTESNAGSRENAERAYQLIMTEKEKLLSLETPLRFIFSHSALKEGWDNPNVFQICALRDIQTERERRQTIGRGLRLCVNQHGERVRGFDVNTLTVIATESYEQFAENLQKEIEADTGIHFGIIEPHQFAAIGTMAENGSAAPLGMAGSREIWDHLRQLAYIDAHGRIQDALKAAIEQEDLDLPDRLDAHRVQITEILRKAARRLIIRNADERKKIAVRRGPDAKAAYLSPEFMALWDRIKHRTTYLIQFDNAKLIQDCIASLKDAPPVPKASIQWRKADIAIGKAGVRATETSGIQSIMLDHIDYALPDVVSILQDRTQLTRRTIVQILIHCGRLNDFRDNPQLFIELAARILNGHKRRSIIENISYRKLGDRHFYPLELLEKEELSGYLKNMLTDAKKSIYEHVIVDSQTERDFVEELERNDSVKLYCKLPGWFKVPTPAGAYRPDWAILIEEDASDHLYFVVETKSGLTSKERHDREDEKIKCGQAHFRALATCENPVRYVVARSLADLPNN